MKSIVLALFFLGATHAFGQEVISKVVADQQSRAAIPYAYVFLNDEGKTGSLSNSDGHFRLELQPRGDSLSVSHIGYYPLTFAINAIAGDTIFLAEKVVTLSEVPIYGIDGEAILQKARESMKKNHQGVEVVYNVFLRSMDYRKDLSAFYTLSEYSVEANPKFPVGLKARVVKSRIRHFGAGVENDYTEVSLFEMFENVNLLPKVLSKGLEKEYSIEFAGTSVEDSRTLLHIHFSPVNEDLPEMTLFIDESTYAVARRLLFQEKQGLYSDTRFKKVGEKWYLSYSFYRKVGYYHFDPEHEIQSEIVIIYELAPQKRVTKEFVSFLKLGLTNWEELQGDWNDPYWEQFRHIPLPAWIDEIAGN